MHKGFILQSTYRVEAGRPVILIYGKLESGGSFLIRDTRQVPSFHIRRTDAARARDLGASLHEEEPTKVTLRGDAVVKVEVRIPQDVPLLRDRLAKHGIECYEADVPFASRYLIDRGIRGTLAIQGTPVADLEAKESSFGAVFENPQVLPSDWIPQLSVLSIDIETDPAASRLLSVALVGCGASEVMLCVPAGSAVPPIATGFPDELSLVKALTQRVRELDPDVITGWNVIDFDLAVLQRVAQRLGMPLALGRDSQALRLRSSNYARAPHQAFVSGRVVLDGIELLRGAYVRLESYALDAAARALLGRGKTFAGPDRPAEILRTFQVDPARFVEYNLNDARLVLEVLSELRLVDLAVERSRLTGMPPDRVSASIASFDFLYLSELTRRGVVAPTVQTSRYSSVPTAGGHVLEPEPGLHRNVLVFDFKSLYPSIIRTFQIDPLGYLPEPKPEDDSILAPNGAAFRRGQGILPRILDDLFPRRERAIASGDQVAGNAIKILMNSFYGVLGTPACRFASPELANAVTGFGREMLLWTKGRIEAAGYRVLYGDTDSLFVLSGRDDADDARCLGTRLAGELNADLAEHISRTWRVESRLALRFERLYLRLFLPAVRHGTEGARKRYAGLVQEGGEARVVFTGMEAVRRDWTDLARQVQRELYLRLFSDRPVEDYLRGVVKELRAGRLDRLLVYRKALRKDLDSYVASTPPHVAAARKMQERQGSLVAYYITQSGPEPAGDLRTRIDYEHYVQKQVRAVADPVLAALGLNFNRIIGDDRQLTLF